MEIQPMFWMVNTHSLIICVKDSRKRTPAESSIGWWTLASNKKPSKDASKQDSANIIDLLRIGSLIWNQELKFAPSAGLPNAGLKIK